MKEENKVGIGSDLQSALASGTMIVEVVISKLLAAFLCILSAACRFASYVRYCAWITKCRIERTVRLTVNYLKGRPDLQAKIEWLNRELGAYEDRFSEDARVKCSLREQLLDTEIDLRELRAKFKKKDSALKSLKSARSPARKARR